MNDIVRWFPDRLTCSDVFAGKEGFLRCVAATVVNQD